LNLNQPLRILAVAAALAYPSFYAGAVVTKDSHWLVQAQGHWPAFAKFLIFGGQHLMGFRLCAMYSYTCMLYWLITAN